MAYESYNNHYNNNPPPPQQPAYSASYPSNDPSSNPYPPYMPYDVSQYAPDPRGHASAHSSDAAQDRTPRPHQGRDYRPSQPHVFEAVNEAFDKSEPVPVPPPNSSSSQIPQDIIQQITQQITEQVRTQVLNDLKTNPAITPQTAPPPPQATMPIPIPQQQPQPRQPMHQSPVATSIPRPVYTPPTPTRFEEDDSSDSSSPTTQEEPKYKTQKEDLNDRYGDRSIPMEERSRSRPAVGARQRTDEEETTLEKIWQPLFDSEGRPTARLGQFLRGVALHLIEDYEPKQSLVIAPHKMLRFYDEISVPNESYPWRDLFARIRPEVLSRVYRSLGCVHHFIQGEANSQPSIPALTPEGFCQWLTLLIQAHPETEFQRLAIVVRDRPISNADDRRERLPKELSRRLFPKHYNSDIRHRCAAALLPPPPPGCPPAQRSSVSDATPVPQATAGASREPSRTSPPPPAPTFAERERAPYSGSVPGGTSTAPTDNLPFRKDSSISTKSTDSISSVSDSGTIPLERVMSFPIERERKPYVAKEGQGKVYEASGGRATGSDATIKPPPPPPSAPPQSSAPPPPPSVVDPLKNGEFDERRRSRSYSQRYSMPPPPPLAPQQQPVTFLASSSSDGGLRAHTYHQQHHGSVSGGVAPSQPSPLAASTISTGTTRSDTGPKRARSPTSSVGSSSNGYVPPSGVQYGGGSGILYSGSSDDEYVATSGGSKRDREERRERERELDEMERRERERRREERKEREREREREYERRERDSKYRDSEREREKLEYDRRERDRLERDRERAEREYRRQTEERERFVDDDVNVSSSQQQQHRRSMVGSATNGYGQPPMGGSLARGAY